MNRKTKKVLCLFICIVLVLGMFPVHTHAAEVDLCTVTPDCTGMYENGVCNVCLQSKPAAPCQHSYADGVCSVCGAAEPCSHSGGTATCKVQAVCEKCDAAYGELGNHDFGTDTDGKCDVCDAECSHSYTEGVCTVCGMAEPVTTPKCSCGVLCNKLYADEECPVCSAGEYGYENCLGEEISFWAASGYTTSNNGMQYKQNDTTIDVQGYDDNNSAIQTTFSNYGYLLKENLPETVSITATPSFMNDGRYVKLSYTATNNGTEAVSGALGICADVMIGADDRAMVSTLSNTSGTVIGLKMVDTNKTGNLQFNLYFRGTGGVTNADRYWIGKYSGNANGGYQNYWNAGPESNEIVSGMDSALAVSWDAALEPGASKTFSVIVGIGEAAAPPQWDSADPVTLTMTAEATKTDLKINVAAKVKDAAGIVDKLFYNVNGDAESQLGNSVTGDGATEQEITGVIDLTGKPDGIYEYLFWIVNDKGATSEAVKRTITITNGAVTGDVTMPSCNENHTWEATWNETQHWHVCEKPWCGDTDTPADHTMTAAANDNTLTATCTCSYSYSASISAPTGSLTYDGTAKSAILNSDAWKGAALSVQYQTKTGTDTWDTATTEAPKAAGTYKASIAVSTSAAARTADPAAAFVIFTISPKELSITGATATGRTYEKGDRAVAITGITHNASSGNAITVEAEGELSSDAAGTYTQLTLTDLTISGNDASNYSLPAVPLTVSANVTIRPKPLTADTITATISKTLLDKGDANPTVTVKDGNNELAAGTDYSITYTKNGTAVTTPAEHGEYILTITGIGNYSDTFDQPLSFLIVDLPDPDTVKPDDKAAIDAYDAAMYDHIHLSEAGKPLYGNALKARLEKLIYALTDYEIIKGNRGKYVKGSKKTLSFTANGYYAEFESYAEDAYGKFTGIEVDGGLVDPKHYTAKAGSTVITLKSSYLESLRAGKHTIQVNYIDGDTGGYDTFRITINNGSPFTGDNMNPALWCGIGLVSLLCLAAVLLVLKKKKT